MVKLAVGKFILDSLLETKVHDGAVVDDGLDRWERDELFFRSTPINALARLHLYGVF